MIQCAKGTTDTVSRAIRCRAKTSNSVESIPLQVKQVLNFYRGVFYLFYILRDPGADSGAEDENQNGLEKIRRAKVRKKITSPWGQTLNAPVPNGQTNTRS